MWVAIMISLRRTSVRLLLDPAANGCISVKQPVQLAHQMLEVFFLPKHVLSDKFQQVNGLAA